MSVLAKHLILIGIVIVIIGFVILGLLKLGFPLGKFPFDIHIKKEKFVFYFPIITSIVVSIVLTILINLFILDFIFVLINNKYISIYLFSHFTETWCFRFVVVIELNR